MMVMVMVMLWCCGVFGKKKGRKKGRNKGRRTNNLKEKEAILSAWNSSATPVLVKEGRKREERGKKEGRKREERGKKKGRKREERGER